MTPPEIELANKIGEMMKRILHAREIALEIGRGISRTTEASGQIVALLTEAARIGAGE